MAQHRPRRSVLYMPGSRSRALEKARTLPADVLILDLEDAVAPTEKETARGLVVEAVLGGGYGGRELVIRVNGLDTPWGADDIAAAAKAGPDAVLIPKVGSAEMVTEIDRLLKEAGAPDTVAIWAMMETPIGILRAEEICAASPRLSALVLGTNDLVKELGAAHTPDRAPVAASLAHCLLAGRAFGQTVLDGVYNAFRDLDGLRLECEQGRAMGFDGKTLIHPGQIETANEVFAPSAEDLTLAARHVEAYEEAERQGQGIAVVDGQIVENLHVETARRLLAQAEAIRALSAE